MSRDVKITNDHKTGAVKVDIELPVGKECDETDAKIRVMLALLGVFDKSVLDDLKRTKVPDGVPNATKVKESK